MPVKGLTGNLKVKLDVTSARSQNTGYLLVLLSWNIASDGKACPGVIACRWMSGGSRQVKGAPSGHPARGKSTCMGEMLAVEQRHTSGAIMGPNLIETRERRVPARAFWFWRMRRVVVSALLGYALET